MLAARLEPLGCSGDERGVRHARRGQGGGGVCAARLANMASAAGECARGDGSEARGDPGAGELCVSAWRTVRGLLSHPGEQSQRWSRTFARSGQSLPFVEIGSVHCRPGVPSNRRLATRLNRTIGIARVRTFFHANLCYHKDDCGSRRRADFCAEGSERTGGWSHHKRRILCLLFPCGSSSMKLPRADTASARST